MMRFKIRILTWWARRAHRERQVAEVHIGVHAAYDDLRVLEGMKRQRKECHGEKEGLPQNKEKGKGERGTGMSPGPSLFNPPTPP